MSVGIPQTAESPMCANVPALRFADRSSHPHDSLVTIGGVPVGGRLFAIIAGPCAVESADQLTRSVDVVRERGAHLLRGGAFKPRTSPYSFQGHGLDALTLLHAEFTRTRLPVVSEILEARDIESMTPYVAAFQVGARNMHNTPLLHALGRQPIPVILKRGFASTIHELLQSAEHIMAGGNHAVVLCERGIRTFETATRNTLDLNAVAVLKRESHLPVLVDPSHGTGRRELVIPLARAAAAVGADGLMVEVHHDPDHALSDGRQSLSPNGFAQLMTALAPFVQAAGRSLR